jgi:hypothetical protein
MGMGEKELAPGPGEQPVAMELRPGEPTDSLPVAGGGGVTSPAAGGSAGITGMVLFTTRSSAQSMAATLPEWPTTRDQ